MKGSRIVPSWNMGAKGIYVHGLFRSGTYKKLMHPADAEFNRMNLCGCPYFLK